MVEERSRGSGRSGAEIPPGSKSSACTYRGSPRNAQESERLVVRRGAAASDREVERRGLGPDADPAEADPLSLEQPLLASLYAASIVGRVATGPRAGSRVLRVGDRVDVEELPALAGERCASVRGVSLHANVAVPARDRRRLERLCRLCGAPHNAVTSRGRPWPPSASRASRMGGCSTGSSTAGAMGPATSSSIP